MAIDKLVLAAQQGDADAFASLYATHHGRVLSQLRRMVKNEADAEELVQDVFLHVWKKIKQFQGKSSFGTWVYRVAFNIALMKFREARAKVRIPLEKLDAYGVGNDGDLPTQYAAPRATDPDLHIDLVRAISKLPQGYRRAILELYVFGHTHEEIASLNGFSKGASKSQTWKAKTKMREMLV